MNPKKEIVKAISEATGVPIGEVHLETPENMEFGDYSTNLAMTTSSKKWVEVLPPTVKKEVDSKKSKGSRNTREIAIKIIAKLKEDSHLSELVENIEAAGPGFINFFLRKEMLYDTLDHITKRFDIYAKSEIEKGKTLIIDYSSPNIAKPFGIGHLRSTIIGQALYNIYQNRGYKVIGDNHLGDWGTQFGKLIYMIKKNQVDDFDIDKLEELYVQFHELAKDPKLTSEMEAGAREWFKKLEEGDIEARKIWQKCVEISKKEFERVYKLLDVKIDFEFGESYYEQEMRSLIDNENVKKHLVPMDSPSKGWVIDLSEYNIKVPLMFLKSDGATTYATRDLATIKYRMDEWNPDIIIYEVGTEQSLHFEQVFAAARKLGIVGKDIILYHTKHGLYLAPDGKKFSTRKGKTIKLEEVLEEAIKRAEKLGSKDRQLAEIVGIGAIKYFDLMHSVQSDVVFDWDKILNMEGNSGPYLQYTYARTQSVLAKVPNSKSQNSNKLQISNYKANDEELVILRTLIHYPEVIAEAAEKYAPNLICNYLYDLAQKFNSFYNAHRILGLNDDSEQSFRLMLTAAIGQVLKNGLNLLGIKAPDKM